MYVHVIVQTLNWGMFTDGPKIRRENYWGYPIPFNPLQNGMFIQDGTWQAQFQLL